MKRESPISVSNLVLPPLVLGFAASASIVFAVIWLTGSALRDAGLSWRFLLPFALIALAIADLAFPKVRIPMLRRQTPKYAVARFNPVLGGLLWGLDTGSVVSTFRASAASWAALLLASTNSVPIWSGLVYAAAFCLPLVIIVRSHHPRAETSKPDRARTIGGGFRNLCRADTEELISLIIGRGRDIRVVSGTLIGVMAAMVVLESSGI